MVMTNVAFKMARRRTAGKRMAAATHATLAPWYFEEF